MQPRRLPLSLLLLLLPALSRSQTLLAALDAQSDFTILSSLLSSYPSLFASLSNSTTTFLAPTDSALAASNLISPSNSSLAPNVSASTLANILSYHFLPGLHNLTEFLAKAQGEIVQTELTSTQYVNLPDGARANVIGAKPGALAGVTGNPSGANSVQWVEIDGGLGQTGNITVKDGDIPFEGGLIQPINSVLSLPDNCSNTLAANNITTFLYLLSLMGPSAVSKYDNYAGLTCFAPSDTAFASQELPGEGGFDTQSVGPVVDNHLFEAVWYTPVLVSGDILVPAWGANNGSGNPDGQKRGFVFTRDNETGEMYIGNAKIIRSDWMLTNGVVHIIDQVLDNNATVPWTGPGDDGGLPPANTSSSSSPSATSSSSSSGDVRTLRASVGAALVALAIGLGCLVWP